MSYSANQPGEQVSIYDQVGGEETFDKLTRRFYALVKADPEFSAMYPDFDPFPPEHLTEEQTAEIEANDTDHFDASARRLKNVPDSVLWWAQQLPGAARPPAFAHPP